MHILHRCSKDYAHSAHADVVRSTLIATPCISCIYSCHTFHHLYCMNSWPRAFHQCMWYNLRGNFWCTPEGVVYLLFKSTSLIFINYIPIYMHAYKWTNVVGYQKILVDELLSEKRPYYSLYYWSQEVLVHVDHYIEFDCHYPYQNWSIFYICIHHCLLLEHYWLQTSTTYASLVSSIIVLFPIIANNDLDWWILQDSVCNTQNHWE